MKYLIAGLGNIGSEYADTRHNIGFMVLDRLAKEEKLEFKLERHAFYTEWNYKGRTLCLIKPTTYMNLSGKALAYWMQHLKIPIENVLVLVDELALPFAKIQLKPKGGSAGHNGLKSIEEALHGQNYARIRFGIGNDFQRGRQADFVLNPFNAEEVPQLPLMEDKGIEIIKSFCTAGIELTMTRLNK